MELPYQQDEVISVLHKSLRKGDIFQSSYFAKAVKELIGVWKVKQYLFFICFEDTNNLELYKKLGELFLKNDSDITDKDIYAAVYMFSKSEKKWDTRFGQDIINHSMLCGDKYHKDINNNYKRYNMNDIMRYGKWGSTLQLSSVCYSHKTNKFKDIGNYTIPDLFALLEEGIEEQDIEKVLYLARVFFDHKDKIPFEYLGHLCSNTMSQEIFKALNNFKGKYGYAFNYLFLFYSFVKGIENCPLELPTGKEITEIENAVNKTLSTKKYLPIPIYALDNHTAKGKALLQNTTIEFSKPLPHTIDLRYSGNRYGVIWRISCIRQFGDLNRKWEEVRVSEKYVNYLNNYKKSMPTT